MATREMGQAAVALRGMVRRVVEDIVQQNVVGVVVKASPLEVKIAGGSHTLREDENLVLSHAVRKYDYDHGLEVGDSVLLVPAGDDYLAAAVVSEKENEIVGFQELVGEAVTDVMLGARLDSDSKDRFQLRADGKALWGPGGATDPDTNLYRAAAGILKTDGHLRAGGQIVVDHSGAGNALYFGTSFDTNLYRASAGILKTDNSVVAAGNISSLLASSDTQPQIVLSRNYAGTGLPGIAFGVGGTTATDTSLYRSAAGTLKTDGALTTGTPLTIVDGIISRPAAGVLRVENHLRIAGFLDVGQDTGWGNNGIRFGSALDTTLYRSAASVLQSNSEFEIVIAAAGAIRRLVAGAADSGGVGFRMVRVAN